ncbi:3'-5' exonuclease (plasmid) [Amycolatopsis sp. FU40]|uniref:3'-5' exonuclease n=1 Tax=Amycolatopsis sp. FU40 TaxID=2914159 RepID=UPI001F2E9852|nr:3'-5' exonuclease [Amycolatopsis sp. FU40]UKD50806.1 3'-5' exonuclease [Amycolatopsis sp. FU40]
MTTACARTWYGPVVLAEEVGLARWQFDRARAAGMLPEPGHARGWLPEQVEPVRALVSEIERRFGVEHPVGAAKCAARLAERLGLAVDPADIAALAEAGRLAVADTFTRKGRTHDLYAPGEVDALTADEVAAVVDDRLAWTAASMTFDEAVAHLGWRRDELDQVVADRGLQRGRFRRFARSDIDALAADTALCDRLADERLVTADEAAQLLEVARRHFDICVEAKWISPKRHYEKLVGRYSTVDVPLYRTGDVDALLARPDVDWTQVRETPKGKRSPLLELVGGRAPTRAQVIRAFLEDFGSEHSIEMWAWWVPGPDVWEIDWERVEGGPAKPDVFAAIQSRPAVARYLCDIQLHCAAGQAIRFARAMLEPGAAVILDTETTDLDGAVCEIAVIDASTGAVLLDTLVNPGVPIQPGAQAVHGISDSEVTGPGVPDWPTVYKRLLRVTKDRIVLAYNADYDRGVITADCHRHGISRTRLADRSHWADVMVPRSDHARSRRWLRNGGGHRALGDVQQTRQHLLRMTAP